MGTDKLDEAIKRFSKAPDMDNKKQIQEDLIPKSRYEKNTIIFRGEVAYDIHSLPEGKSIDEIMDLYTKSGILVYDARLGKAPYSVKHNSSKSE